MSTASPEAATGARMIQAGSANKTGTSLSVTFDPPFDRAPVVLVGSFWDGSANGVGFTETLTAVTATGFTVTSGNRAPDYYVSWIACAATT